MIAIRADRRVDMGGGTSPKCRAAPHIVLGNITSEICYKDFFILSSIEYSLAANSKVENFSWFSYMSMSAIR